MTAKAALKLQNVTWIWTVVVADALVLIAFAFPQALDQAGSWLTSSGSRLAGASLAPVVVLLLTSLLSSDVKAMLVFWRMRDVLPGHRAFSVYGPKDPRVDLARLRAVTGEFPASPREENAVWYRLFKKVEGDAAVSLAHRYFLLFRDITALSALLLVIAPAVLAVLGAPATSVWLALGFLAVQYLAAAIAAKHHGVALICNVLALHGASESNRKRASLKK